tara:strand:+ start:527 stop:823 length:297 start_codon:yes stop_codon:yes gene_type:complete
LVEAKTAKKEIPKKRISIVFHQIGVSAQQVDEHVLAMNKKGVAKQCTKHNPLTIIPKWSDLSFVTLFSIPALNTHVKVSKNQLMQCCCVCVILSKNFF